MYNTLLTSLDDSILTITVNRPDKLNAINPEVMREIGEVVAEVNRNPEIKSAIITGAGPKAFVAGADISAFSGIQQEGFDLSRAGQEVFFSIERSAKPFIAAVNGYALGAGCELAMSCQLRLASVTAKFGQPEVNLGLLPGYGGSQRLVQLIGRGRALEMLMTATPIDAQTAFHYGLVNQVFPADQLLEKAAEILRLINSKAPLAVAGCIQAVNAVFDETQDGYALEAKLFGEYFATEDLKEGKNAFLEKRAAKFTGR